MLPLSFVDTPFLILLQDGASNRGRTVYAIHYRIMWDEFSYLFYMDHYVPGKEARDAAAWVFFGLNRDYSWTPCLKGQDT